MTDGDNERWAVALLQPVINDVLNGLGYEAGEHVVSRIVADWRSARIGSTVERARDALDAWDDAFGDASWTAQNAAGGELADVLSALVVIVIDLVADERTGRVVDH